jgi:GPH family glycoside/pentoside/hexuronide:cation symporter
MSDTMRLPLKTKIGFGICDIGGNLFFTAMAFHLAAFLTDTLGLAASLMGIAVMIGRTADAFTDPIMGYLSDRTRTRWGRRRPFLFFGAPPLAVLFFIMFTSPAFLTTQMGIFAWVTGVYVLLTTAYTVVNIPYGALTPDLTRDYDEQTSLNAFRMSFAVIGTLIGAGAALPIINSAVSRSAGYARMGALFGMVSLVTAWITFFAVREPPPPEYRRDVNVFREYLKVITDRTFLRILIPWAAFVTGVTLASGILIYFCRYIMNDEGLTTTLMLVLLLSALGFIPLWVRLSKRIGKKMSYTAGMILFSAAVLFLAYLGDRMAFPVLLAAVAVAGVGLSTHYVMPYSLIPDAVENNFAETGERNGGIFYGLWTFCSKIGQALAILITGIVLDLTRYVPNLPQDLPARQGIRFLLGPLPLLFILAGAAVLRRYPIDREYYKGILAKIALAEAGAGR